MVSRFLDVRTITTTVTSALSIALVLWLNGLDARVRDNTSRNAVDKTYNEKIDSLSTVLIRVDTNVKNLKESVGELKIDLKEVRVSSTAWRKTIRVDVDRRIDKIERRIEN